MSKYFVVPLIFLSLSFSFFNDSHVGDDKKTEVGYMQHPALTGFTDTPKEGRLKAGYSWSPLASISNTYNTNGEVQSLMDTEKLSLSTFSLKMDYFGYKKSGITLHVGRIQSDYSNESLNDMSLSTIGATVYWIWGDQFTFPVYRIKTEVGVVGSGSSTSGKGNASIDYYLTDIQMISTTIGLNNFSAMTVANNDTSAFSYTPISLNTKFIHNFSENIAVSGMYRTVFYSDTPDEVDMNISSIQISAGLQLTDLKYGYYHFNFGLKPAIEFPLSGKNHSKLNIFSIGFVLDFI